jgi:hypothetical protein
MDIPPSIGLSLSRMMPVSAAQGNPEISRVAGFH